MSGFESVDQIRSWLDRQAEQIASAKHELTKVNRELALNSDRVAAVEAQLEGTPRTNETGV
jgi:hypothetical protein